MGLKCSVLGHKYGDAEVERDREEQGSEVVITIREVETCTRCGQERVVSENKEVTSIATPDDPAGDGTADAGVDEFDEADDDATTSDEGASAVADDVGVGDVETDAGVADAADAPVDDVDEGAEILDAESDEPVTDDELADPSIEESPADPDPSPGDGHDAVIMDDDADEDDAAGERAPGEWPEEPEPADEEWSPSDVLDEDSTITAPDEGTDANSAVTVPDGEFHCPECGYTTPVESSSLRAGDFCPECRTGTLVHRPDEARRNG